MLEELSNRLTHAFEQKRLKEKLEMDLYAVEKELKEEVIKKKELCAQLEKEKVDVERLEEAGLTTLFFSILGTREQKLDKERQEFLAAQLKYRQSEYQKVSLEKELEGIKAQLKDLQDADSRYQTLLSSKEEFLLQSNHAAAAELAALSEQIAELNSKEKEIGEAIAAGKQVVSGLMKIGESLVSAENWGVLDMMGGGMFATAAKQSSMDEAGQELKQLQTRILQFRRELDDLNMVIPGEVQLDEFESFADFFLDCLIVDWSIQEKIVKSLDQTRTAQETVARFMDELDRQKQIVQHKNLKLKEQRVLLLENV